METENKEQSAYSKLSPKRQKFVDEYVVDFNGTQAAIRAGYAPKAAQEQAARLLSNAIVRHAVDDKKAEIAKKNEVTVDWVVQRAKDLVERCMQAVPVYDNEGNPTGEYKLDSAGANGSLKILAKYLGMEKSNITVDLPKGFQIVFNKPDKAASDK